MQPYITVDGSGNPLTYPDLISAGNLVDHPKVAVSASGVPVVTWVIAELGIQADQADAVLRQTVGSGIAAVLKPVPFSIPAGSFGNPVFV